MLSRRVGLIRKPKVYFLACAFPPFGRGNAITNFCAARGLAEFFRVQVICKELDDGLLLNYQEDASLLADLPADVTVERVPGGRWLGLNEILYGIGLLPCYYVNWAWSVWRQRRQLLREPGVIFAVYPVFSDLLVGYLLSRAYGYPFLVDFRDDFSGVMSRGWRRFLRGWYRRMEAGLVRQADGVSVTTETLKRDLVSRHGLDADKVSVVFNIVPETARISSEKMDFVKTHAGHQLIVTYAGAISRIQRMEILPLAYARLVQRTPVISERLKVEIFGPDSGYFRRHVRPHLVEGVDFGGFLPKLEIDEKQAVADIGFLSLGDATYAYATPTKLFDYIELGLPIVAALPHGAARDIIEGHDLGLVVELGDVEGLADSLERMVDDADLRRRCRDNARRARSEFRSSVQIQRWREQLSRMAVEEGDGLGVDRVEVVAASARTGKMVESYR